MIYLNSLFSALVFVFFVIQPAEAGLFKFWKSKPKSNLVSDTAHGSREQIVFDEISNNHGILEGFSPNSHSVDIPSVVQTGKSLSFDGIDDKVVFSTGQAIGHGFKLSVYTSPGARGVIVAGANSHIRIVSATEIEVKLFGGYNNIEVTNLDEAWNLIELHRYNNYYVNLFVNSVAQLEKPYRESGAILLDTLGVDFTAMNAFSGKMDKFILMDAAGNEQMRYEFDEATKRSLPVLSQGKSIEFNEKKDAVKVGEEIKLGNKRTVASWLKFKDAEQANQLGLKVDEWHHVVLLKEGQSESVYVNGTLWPKDFAMDKISWFGLSDESVEIGKNSATKQHFNGILDDFRLYNVPLTSHEILHLYTEGARGMDAGDSALVLHKNFDQDN